MERELKEFGLTDNEINVYIVCLKVGKATANRISELADLPRSTTYDTLEKLKDNGLIASTIIENKTNYIANNPNVLLTNLEEKKTKIKNILPALTKIRNNVGDRPIAEVFQGKIAVVKLLDEILDNAKSLKIIGSQGNALKKIDYRPEQFRIKRLDKNILVKQILEVSDESKKLKNDKYTEVKFLKSLNESKEATFIFEDYVYHLLLEEEISGIKIKSKEHFKTNEIIFDSLWKIAKK